VLRAEGSEIGRDRDPLERAGLEVLVDGEQLRLGVPSGVVERPVVPGCVDVEDLLLAGEA
jgi:hypothetical protein